MMFFLLTVAVEPMVFPLTFKDYTGARDKNVELHYNFPPALDHRDNPQFQAVKRLMNPPFGG